MGVSEDVAEPVDNKSMALSTGNAGASDDDDPLDEADEAACGCDVCEMTGLGDDEGGKGAKWTCFDGVWELGGGAPVEGEESSSEGSLPVGVPKASSTSSSESLSTRYGGGV